MPEEQKRVLLVSGSLRTVSLNTAILRAIQRLAPASIETVFYTGMRDLPPFDPEEEANGAPDVVLEWAKGIAEADAVLISSPEYAHGVPGVLKNALDWVVGSGEFSGKAVALVNVSPHSTHAQASLTEILKTMDARLVHSAFLTFSLKGQAPDPERFASDPAIARSVSASFAALLDQSLPLS
jgi:NAD(P)H-dependent FMN reductase